MGPTVDSTIKPPNVGIPIFEIESEVMTTEDNSSTE